MVRHRRSVRDAIRRRRGDRGLAIVEFAIVAPLLALLAAGIIEFGMAWRDNLTISNATRASARVASNLGDNALADFESLLSLEAAMAGINGATINDVLIYDPSLNGGNPSPLCFTGSTPQDSDAGNCNHYSAADLASLVAADFGDCTTGKDRYYCPLSERDTNQTSLSDVGVWIRIDREWFTNVFPGDGITMEDHTVMRLEPAT